MSLFNIILKEIEDTYIRENFRNMNDFLQKDAILNTQMQHINQSFTKNDTFLISHTLKSIPKDVIQTSLTGTGSLVYNYSAFTSDKISITTSSTDSSDPLVVRFFVGTYTGR